MVAESDATLESGPDEAVDRSDDRLAALQEWVLLTGDRNYIAAGLLAGVFLVTTAIEFLVGPRGSESAPMFYMASAIVGGNFTLLTIVISINQLVISRHLSAPGELQDEIANTAEYRDAAIGLLETDTAPVTPPSFLELLHRGVQDSVDRLRAHEAHLPAEPRAALDDLLDAIERQVDETTRLLQDCEPGIFEALVITLDTNYSTDIHQVWQVRTRYDEELDAEATSALSSLVRRLKQIDVARQYLKTLYIQEELSRLSRHLLYVGGPTIVFGVALLQLFVTTETTVVASSAFSFLVPVFATVGIAPLALLFAFVLRLSTVSERTVAVTPFTTPTQEQQPDMKADATDQPASEE